MASLTFDIAPACDPGEPEGCEIGDDPMEGCPESEGGIIGGILLALVLPLATVVGDQIDEDHGILALFGHGIIP